MIFRYKNFWNWSNLSENKKLPWSIDLIKLFEKKWDWQLLCYNESIPWTRELIITYQNKWQWKNAYNSMLIIKYKRINFTQKELHLIMTELCIKKPIPPLEIGGWK